MKCDDMVAMYLREMSDHRLEVLASTDAVKCYRMARPGTGIYSVYLTFTQAGIAIQGDLTPERNGSCSSRGYDVDWFSEQLSGSYLCEKFLAKRWVAELAADEIRDPMCWMREDSDSRVLSELDAIADEVSEHGPEWFHDELEGLGFDVSDGFPGHGYEPFERAVLVAIQRKFAELYGQQEGGAK